MVTLSSFEVNLRGDTGWTWTLNLSSTHLEPDNILERLRVKLVSILISWRTVCPNNDTPNLLYINRSCCHYRRTSITYSVRSEEEIHQTRIRPSERLQDIKRYRWHASRLTFQSVLVIWLLFDNNFVFRLQWTNSLFLWITK